MERFVFRLADIGEGVTEAEIVAWHIKPGDTVHEDQPLVDVMTNKATVEITSPIEGRVVTLHGDLGAIAAVGAPLIDFDLETTDQTPAPEPEPAAAPAAKAVEPAPPPEPQPHLPLAAPATRHRARELGVALESVVGTGPEGRVTPEDLEAHVAAASAAKSAAVAPKAGVEVTKLVGLRRRIAEKMQESKRTIPHFGYIEEFDLTALEALRQNLNAEYAGKRPKLTLLPFLMRALVRTIPEFPQVNARFDDAAGELSTFEAVHIGVATQTPGGLMVPVVRHAETLDLWACAAEMQKVTQAARDGTAKPDQLSGSTITITSLGPLGGVAATPIINHPEVAIVGPNKLVDRAVVVDGGVVVRKMMNVSSSFDHRIVDGYDAASFIQRLKRLLENPALIFID